MTLTGAICLAALLSLLLTFSYIPPVNEDDKQGDKQGDTSDK